MITVDGSWRCRIQRNAAALVWLPVLLVDPALNLPVQGKLWAALLLVAMAASAGVAVISGPVHRGCSRRLPIAALLVLAAATLTGTVGYGPHWLTPWLLLAITVAAVLRGGLAAAALVAVTLAAVVTVWWTGGTWDQLWTQAFTVLLAGFATLAFVQLIDTVGELRRTREELARRAVIEERERFSSDLHDLLGHSLSVIVVKAQAVRRLVDRDPAAATQHAEDIETVGRGALTDVRQAVDGYRGSTLEDEVIRARWALKAAGIETQFVGSPLPLPAFVDETLTWVVREGVTNVLRHSTAQRCRIEIRQINGETCLELSDDGIGATRSQDGRVGGLEGLRHRLASAHGRLDIAPSPSGFRLTASVPQQVPHR